MNRCAFRHSAGSLPLTLSMSPLSVGLPLSRFASKPLPGKGAREIRDTVLLVGSEIEIPTDERRPQVDSDRPGVADAPADPLQCLDDILAAIAEARIDPRREADDGVDHRQDSDLAASSQLTMHKVPIGDASHRLSVRHCPSLVALRRGQGGVAQLRLDPTFGHRIALCS